MTRRERALRSRLNQLVSDMPFLRGTLSLRAVTCGKSNCRCQRGEKHRALYLVASEDGKPRQLFIPKSKEDDVRQWVENFRQIRELQEEVSLIYWEKLRKRER